MNATANLRITGNFLTEALSSALVQKPTVMDLYRFVRSHPTGPQNFGWMLSAAHVGDGEAVEVVKRRLTYALPIWEQAWRNGHWSALARPGRISAAKTILNFIEEFEELS